MATQKRNAVAEHDACSTVSTFDGDGGTVFHLGAAIQNRYVGTYGGRFS